MWLARRAVLANWRALPNDSRYKTASSVLSSAPHHSSRSVPETSSISPTETSEEIPMPSRANCSARAAPTPPDWTAIPALPGRGQRTACVASSAIPGTATPKEAGPSSRMLPCLVAASRPDSCSGVRPEVITARALTPRPPHSRATSTTDAGGTVTTARSGASGRSATDGTHRMPSMSPSCRLTAYTAPGKPPSRMPSRTARPRDPGR